MRTPIRLSHLLKRLRTNEYYNLEKLFNEIPRKGHFERKLELLQQMMKVIENGSGKFDEPDDRMRVLQCRAYMVEYYRERLRGGRRVLDLIHQASECSVPTVCLEKPCHADPTQCVNFRGGLTTRQKTMCLFRMTYLQDYYKIAAALSARQVRGDKRQPVALRRKAVCLAELLAKLEPSRADARNPDRVYLKYWLAVSEGALAIEEARFPDARNHFKEALKLGSQLDSSRCFPNYFSDLSEIAAHEDYIDAVEYVHDGHFADARNSFAKWLHIRKPAKYKGTRLLFDNIAIFEKICAVLVGLPASSVSLDSWREIERLLDRKYVARPTWVLWHKLQEFRYLSSRIDSQEGTSKNSRFPFGAGMCRHFPIRCLIGKWRKTKIASLLFERKMRQELIFPSAQERNEQLQERCMAFANNWNLFVPDALLLGEDRLAGLRRPVVMFSPLNVFEDLDPQKHDWKKILRQNLRHLLLLMAEFEQMRYALPPPEEAPRRGLENPPIVDEYSSMVDLIAAIKKYLEPKMLRIFEKALKLLPVFDEALESGDFCEAIAAQKDMFNIIRSWPHVIRVLTQEDIPAADPMEEEPELLAYRTKVERLWSKEPNEATFDGPDKLEYSGYYYLRPRWNVRSGDHYRVRHERFYPTHLPRWLEIFQKNIFTSERVKSDQFHAWILQFREEERLLCCRLFDALRIYDKDRIVKTWRTVYRQIPPPVLRDTLSGKTVFVRLGHGAKSGSLSTYHFRQAMSQEPEYEVLFKGNEKRIFRDISEFPTNPELDRPDNVVFLDDFIGTGGQATDFVAWYLEKCKWLQDVTIYVAVLAGYENAVRDVTKNVMDKYPTANFNVIVGDVLAESDKAFSGKNAIWTSEGECKKAHRWAEDIGKQVLQGAELYNPEREALGWKGYQALVAFEHNTPSDTLPIFWAEGIRDGRQWIPLCKRYD